MLPIRILIKSSSDIKKIRQGSTEMGYTICEMLAGNHKVAFYAKKLALPEEHVESNQICRL